MRPAQVRPIGPRGCQRISPLPLVLQYERVQLPVAGLSAIYLRRLYLSLSFGFNLSYDMFAESEGDHLFHTHTDNPQNTDYLYILKSKSLFQIITDFFSLTQISFMHDSVLYDIHLHN